MEAALQNVSHFKDFIPLHWKSTGEVDKQKIAAMVSKQIPMASLPLVWIYHKEKVTFDSLLPNRWA